LTISPTEGSPRVLIVGDDGEVGAVLHLHLLRAGWSPVCVPSPDLVEPIAPIVTPHAIVLVLPETPATSWAAALTTAASAAQAGVRVILVAPSRDVVEPLASVSGAERAMARSEVLVAPRTVLGPPPPRGVPPPIPPRRTPIPPRRTGVTGATSLGHDAAPLARESSVTTYTLGLATPPPTSGTVNDGASSSDLADLLQEDPTGTPMGGAASARLVADVTLVSEHNFFVGPTRRLDSGGVFVSTPHPPPLGTTLEMRLGLPDARKLDVRGEVVFVRVRGVLTGRQPAGCGVKLSGVPSWAVEVVERFFVARPPILYQP
jgi:Tfp pilus assembly protein PilZ